MLAISFSRRDKAQASAILSDAIAIAAVLGCCLTAAMYFYAPPALRAINGWASAELVEPAVTYVRWRCTKASGCAHARGPALLCLRLSSAQSCFAREQVPRLMCLAEQQCWRRIPGAASIGKRWALPTGS
jgi:hypothetical protein